MNLLHLIPESLHPQWYCAHNHEDDTQRFFDTKTELADYLIENDFGPESPKFTVHEVDFEFMKKTDYENANAWTAIGGLLVGNYRPVLGDVIATFLGLALAFFVGSAAYKHYADITAAHQIEQERIQ